ncbi:MAG: hypothetical protein D3904_07805 [Candidatus Electrothrix sp. EH2]|nr:hypothetical protein [Candidatus Electrothrix sp. EH2]
MSQTQVVTAIAVVLILAAAIILRHYAARRSPYEAAKESMEYQTGPIRHPKLPASLIERIRKFEKTFAEVYPVTHKEWLDGFKRDANPEREIAIWEQMASAYTQFLRAGDFDEEVRMEAFGLLLVRSSTADIELLFSDLKHLTEEQARSLLSLYRAAPQPVTVCNAESAE